MNNRAAEPAFDDFRLIVHFENSRKSETIYVRHEATYAVRKDFRQHWDGAVNEVNRSGALQGLCVNSCTFADIVRNVCNVDSDFVQLFLVTRVLFVIPAQ